MKIIFLAYREWSLEVYNSIKENSNIVKIVLCKTHNELLDINLQEYDLLMTCGWSEELGLEITDKIKQVEIKLTKII